MLQVINGFIPSVYHKVFFIFGTQLAVWPLQVVHRMSVGSHVRI